jgi:hypothetical protein
MWPVGALDNGVKLPRPVDVVGVVAFAAKKPNILFPANGCADTLKSHGR